MIISTQTEHIARATNDFNAVRIIAEAGFDAIDYSMFDMSIDSNVLNTPHYKNHVMQLRDFAKNLGISFNQAHAMFPTMKDGDELYNKKVFPRIARAIEICSIMQIPNVVVHPVQFKENQLEKNIELYNRLEPFCAEFGVKVALENMWGYNSVEKHCIPNVCSTAEDFNRYLDALNPEHFTACLDIGHCALVGVDAAEMIRSLGHDRLTCLHVHDNNLKDDSHQPPFTMKTDWQAVAQALKEIDYSGDLTLEADQFITHMPEDLFPQAEHFMCCAARKLAKMIEG